MSKWILVAAFIAGACMSACESDDDDGGAGASASGGVGGMTGGVGGATGGTGGTTGGAGGVAGAMQGGMGGAAGMGGMTGGMGGMTGGMGGMTGGMGGMTGGMGGMTGGMGGMGGTGGMDAAATFTDVYAIIEMRCGGGTFGCHVMGESGMLNMQSKMEAFENLVDVDSEECNGEKRVVAGDADASLIVKALEGTACIDQMPDGRDPLPASEIATIREWIEAGAMND